MRVLLIVHGFPPWATGGTEIYTHDFARALRDQGDEVFIFTREANPALPEFHVRSEERNGLHITAVNNTFRQVSSFEESYRNPRIRQIGARVFDTVRPSVAHVHHLTGLSTDLTLQLAARRIPIVFTLHDYWLMCHRGQLLDVDYHLCPGPDPDICLRCLGIAGVHAANGRVASAWRWLRRRSPSLVVTGIDRMVSSGIRSTHTASSSANQSAKRSQHMRTIMAPVDQFLALSNALRDRFIRFGVEESRIAWVSQGIDRRAFLPHRKRQTSCLCIGFFGSVMISKAPHLLLEAFAALPDGVASLDLYGAHAGYHGDDRYRHRIEPLLSTPGVRYHGAIPHEKVSEAIGSLDVVVVPSIWLENCPLVIREAFAAGVPVVAARLGGMAELVSDGRNGLLFETGNAEDLRRVLLRVIQEPDLLPTLRAGVQPGLTIQEDVSRTRQLYNSLTRSPIERDRA